MPPAARSRRSHRIALWVGVQAPYSGGTAGTTPMLERGADLPPTLLSHKMTVGDNSIIGLLPPWLLPPSQSRFFDPSNPVLQPIPACGQRVAPGDPVHGGIPWLGRV